MGMALHYLGMIPEDSSGPTGVLKYRIYYSGSPEVPGDTPEPEYPFQEGPQAESSYQDQGYQEQAGQPSTTSHGELTAFRRHAVHLKTLTRNLSGWSGAATVELTALSSLL